MFKQIGTINGQWLEKLMMPSVAHSFIPLPEMSYMWENTKKSIKWERLEKGILVKKEEREIYQCHSHTMFHICVNTVRIMITMFSVLETISLSNFSLLYCLFIIDNDKVHNSINVWDTFFLTAGRGVAHYWKGRSRKKRKL